MTLGVIITPQMAHEAQLINPKVEVANIPNTGHCIRRDDFGGYIAAFAAFLHRVTVWACHPETMIADAKARSKNICHSDEQSPA